ncbi:MAG: sodium:proton antiporter [Lachnospiraceae bacterium]|nr:sodium:proton antiporter [Lachnospiraceae bacterium]
MEFIWNFPLFSIVACLFVGVISSVLGKKAARILSWCLLGAVTAMSGAVLYYTISIGGSFTYMMGHFPAPWGNEVRAGVLEGMVAVLFSVIMLFAVIAGKEYIEHDLPKGKQNLYYSLVALLMSSLLALVYTNDIFTAYVFVEINTIAACGMVMMKNTGRSILAATKYMIMSLIGSGLLLIGITLLYELTGHLLMCDIKEAIDVLVESGQYQEPLTVIIALISVALAIKSALYPFHSWLPDAHGYSTPTSSAVLSGLVTKAYIFLLVKIFFRVIGWEVILQYKITDILFVFGVIGMIMGSVNAIMQKDAKKMIAYSSIAQFGYIYMGLGLGNIGGIIAAVFHMFMHGAVKSMLFISVGGLVEVSDEKTAWSKLTGSGYRNKVAGVAFTAGAIAMIGIPLFGGFISKILFATAAVDNSMVKMVITLLALAVSTMLNAWYFFKAIIRIYTPRGKREKAKKPTWLYVTVMAGFIVLNVFLGVFSDVVIEGIEAGIGMFV